MLRRPAASGALFQPQQDRTLPVATSQLLQLCQALYQSGFFFEDCQPTELDRSEEVLRRFFRLNPSWWRQLAPLPRLQQFLEFAARSRWDGATAQAQLQRKIRRACQQLNQSGSQPHQLRRNLLQASQLRSSAVLADFLVFLESYYRLVLKNPGNEPAVSVEPAEEETSDRSYSIQEVLQLRRQMEERLEQRAFVKALVSRIAESQGLPAEDFLNPKTRRQLFRERSDLPKYDPDQLID